jgi:demethylmenaquinone methyltransferase/2-methoxy-6-polyprenyl-1,4-benzoquinol methylase
LASVRIQHGSLRLHGASVKFDGMSSAETEEREALDAAAGGEEKRAYVRRIFSEIAPSYDLLNHLLSLNIDRGWRDRAIRALALDRRPRGTFLDICAGTLDVSAELARTPGFEGTVVAVDFAEPMLRRGAAKTRGLPVRPMVADALRLPLATGSSDGAIVAFGARNFDALDEALRELARVLAPGARLVILELSTPPSRLVRLGYHLYFHRVLPLVGRLVSGHRTAYSYLPASVANFPAAEELARKMERAGFEAVHFQRLTFGTAAVHWGEAPASIAPDTATDTAPDAPPVTAPGAARDAGASATASPVRRSGPADPSHEAGSKDRAG